MFAEVPLFPDQASTIAEQVDHLFFFMLAVTGSVGILVAVLVIVFAVKYRRRAEGQATPRIAGNLGLEWFWTLVPLAIFLVMFAWGASVFSTVTHPPADATEIFVVGKQWMWKIQHSGGQREINELHVPLGKAIKLTLISEDVIHDFGLPAFRTKVDVIPNRYVHTWFRATKLGEHHIFCDQYCGTSHAEMIGTVFVMEPRKYEEWLNSRAEGSLALQGRKLFLKYQCVTCHSPETQRAPLLEGLFGKTVFLKDHAPVVADMGYIRESILYPRAKIVQGWEPIMPTFKGQVGEEDLIQLVAYVKSLQPGQTPNRNEEFPAPVGAPTTPKEDKATKQ
jgi:cytochrome c oxidase subunit 2